MAKEQADCTSADNRGEGRIFLPHYWVYFSDKRRLDLQPPLVKDLLTLNSKMESFVPTSTM